MSSIKHESNIGHTWRVSRRGVLCAGEAAAFSLLVAVHGQSLVPYTANDVGRLTVGP